MAALVAWSQSRAAAAGERRLCRYAPHSYSSQRVSVNQQLRRGGGRRRWLNAVVLSSVLSSLSPPLWAEPPPSQAAARSEAPAEPSPAHEGSTQAGQRRSGSPPWLTWTLAGLGGASLITGITAWRIRQGYAERWNGDECVRPGQTRIQVCPYDYAGVRDAEGVAWVSGVTTVVMLGGAVTSWILQKPGRPESTAAGVVCGISGLSASCSGSF